MIAANIQKLLIFHGRMHVSQLNSYIVIIICLYNFFLQWQKRFFYIWIGNYYTLGMAHLFQSLINFNTFLSFFKLQDWLLYFPFLYIFLFSLRSSWNFRDQFNIFFSIFFNFQFLSIIIISKPMLIIQSCNF